MNNTTLSLKPLSSYHKFYLEQIELCDKEIKNINKEKEKWKKYAIKTANFKIGTKVKIIKDLQGYKENIGLERKIVDIYMNQNQLKYILIIKKHKWAYTEEELQKTYL